MKKKDSIEQNGWMIQDFWVKREDSKRRLNIDNLLFYNTERRTSVFLFYSTNIAIYIWKNWISCNIISIKEKPSWSKENAAFSRTANIIFGSVYIAPNSAIFHSSCSRRDAGSCLINLSDFFQMYFRFLKPIGQIDLRS